MDAVFFNLFVNATFSLLMGLGIVFACIAFLRIKPGPWKLFLLGLPFVKVLFDFAQGVPMSSVLFTPIDPLNAPPGAQTFTIGLGMNDFGPGLKAIFTLRDGLGYFHGVSAGDYLVFWIAHHFGVGLPRLLLLMTLLITSVLLLRRVISVVTFEWQRRRDRKFAACLQTLSVGWRKVDVYISLQMQGSPFTGGLLRPYICLPEATVLHLTSDEIEAVIAHELGHIRQWDLLVTFLIQITGDVFWFVPGYRWLGRKMDRLREVMADQVAVRAGTDPVLLASVLVKLKEIPLGISQPPLYSAFFRERSLLKTRVHALLGTEISKPSRWLWRSRWSRALICFWVAGTVLNSNLAGNHTGLLRAPEGLVKRVLELIQPHI